MTDIINWGLFSLLLALTIMAFFYRLFERSRASSKEVAVIAVLGTVAALSRLPFAGLPNIQPTTFIIIISGYVFGAQAGFMIGSTAALVSNFFLGHGPWTPWQMLAWGLAGFSAGLFRKLGVNSYHWVMLPLNVAWGYFFGWLINLWFWLTLITPLSWQSLLAVYAASFWFDTMHAFGNVFFYILFGSGTIRILMRTRKKLEVTYLGQVLSPDENRT